MTARPSGAFENLVLLAEVGSTQSLAKRLVENFSSDELDLPSTLVVARRQEDGRGRSGRSWLSPAGGLYVTAVTSFTGVPGEILHLPLAVGATLAQALNNVFGIGCRLKWPNDVMVNGLKIAGLLMEHVPGRNEGASHLLAGVGLNVSSKGLVGLEGRATSLQQVSQVEAPFEDVLAAVAGALSEALLPPLAADAAIASWNRLAAHRPGDSIRVRLTPGGELVEGVFRGLDPSGRLRFERDGRTLDLSSVEELEDA